jgi:RNA polymerase sigma-70 factor (ECF subfamily)
MSGMPTTRWSLVLQAAADDPEVARRAVGTLCALYREPLLAYFHRECGDRVRAEDLVQSLLADLVARGDFARADRDRGRLRSYLLGAARHRLQNERRRESVRREVALPEEDAGPATALTPEDEFQLAWVRRTIEIALEDLEADYARRGAARLFQRMLPYLAPDGDEPPYATIAAELGKQPGAVKTDVWRFRTRFGAKLRDLVAATTADEEVDGELRALASLRGARP